ncbi:hypothetical protein ACOI1C_17930 [Bacillus sp. DJP31]|uniref:hypothetical protein n=1 Tax=Bacillus sp. DJP31 TaxID=3409789 RepID=UPI003BB58DED
MTFFSEADAADIALLFVLNNMNEENNWDKSTKVAEVHTLYNLEGLVTGYTFELMTKGEYSGYITISSRLDEMPIQEYSYESLPVFEEKVQPELLEEIRKDKKDKLIYNGPLEYFVLVDGKHIDMDKKEVKDLTKINKKLQKAKNNVDVEKINRNMKRLIKDSYMGGEYNGQLEGYAISDRFAFMSDRWGSYNWQNSDFLSSYTGLDMNNYGSSNDCVVVAITTVANWYDDHGKPNIPNSTYDIYKDVLVKAKTHGYTPSGGTNPTVIDNIIEDSFRTWGYSVNASNTYAWSYSTFTNEINANRPVLFNIGSGYYAAHTVSVFGYVEYDVANFLQVKDNWTTATRYIHWGSMWNGIGSVTSFR